jgi:tRNA U34 2-thiouridine synthase MnmA/TrmU
MNSSSEKATIRALGLCSGGLDSILAALLLRRQGIQVFWISFETPFFSADKARRAAEQYDIPIEVADITKTYLEMMKAPACGFGKHMNPCMDCHALMVRLAGKRMRRQGFDFLFSGEVMGQRPMSQTRSSLRYVEKNSGFDGFILRPLSAQKLPETLPEKKGLVDRQQLLGLSGRSRKPQMALARAWGIVDYPAPAGGCLLTDKGYSKRLRDLFEHQAAYTKGDLQLLKFGRHLRLNPQCKIVVGRTKADNSAIHRHINHGRDTVFKVLSHPGPLTVMPAGSNTETVLLAAAISAGYTKAPEDTPVAVEVTDARGAQTVTVLPIPPGTARQYLI